MSQSPPRPLQTLPPRALPSWTMPSDLATLVAEDGEWEDPSWDPLLLTVVGDTRHEGRDIAMAWQLSLWPEDAPEALRPQVSASFGKPDGHGWAGWLLAALADRAPALVARVHDDSDGATCVLWVEAEADGRALMEAAWRCLQEAAL